MAERRNEEAISHYKMAIKLMPTHAEAYNNLGTTLFADRKTEEAISHFKMAIELKPDLKVKLLNLAIVDF